jgi:hypothetical protein
MKCVRCGGDCKYSERRNRKCPKCNGEFAFEPREGDRVSDMLFQRAIESVSAAGRVRWGVEHLYYEVGRRKRIPRGVFIFFGILSLAVGMLSLVLGLIFHQSGWFAGLLIASVVIALGTLTSWKNTRFLNLSEDIFRGMWDRWVRVHGTPKGVIQRKKEHLPPQGIEPDVADYSFDRAVICDRARTVDLLLANNFHFENNCAVLSIEGYPPGPFDTVRKMLRRNPRLQVYSLHDATREGCSLAHRLATDPSWFADQTKVIDVGLRPVHGARSLGLLRPASTSNVPATESISSWEASWLNKYKLELAAIRPEQVLKRLFAAINMTIDPAAHPGPVIYLPPRNDPRDDRSGGDGTVGNGGTSDGERLASDGTDVDGPADSFG